jgi:ABC-2 type transport system ATP-binding protein
MKEQIEYLQMQDVVVEFGTAFKLGPIQMDLRLGQSIGVIGKNGAGKSTWFEVLSGNLDCQGSLLWKNQRLSPDAAALKAFIGYLPQRHKLPLWATPASVVSYVSAIRGHRLDRNTLREKLKYWGCHLYHDKPLASLSHGMRKRVSLTLATMHLPEILILDEPFSGLDLIYIEKLKDLLKQRQRQGQTTIFSTHVIPFLHELSDSVLLVKDGNITDITHKKEGSAQALSDYIAKQLLEEADHS